MRHDGSANLIPRRKGEPAINPYGRAGQVGGPMKPLIAEAQEKLTTIMRSKVAPDVGGCRRQCCHPQPRQRRARVTALNPYTEGN